MQECGVYVKLFSSLYQGTLRGRSDEILVFTNLLAHADMHGNVDKHFKSISEETGLPRERVEAAIQTLEAPDPESRSPEMHGCRLVRMDDHRIWGWKIVNYGKYRAIRNEEDRREQNRTAQERFRNKHSKPRKPEKAQGEGEGEGEALKSKSLAPDASRLVPKSLDTGEVIQAIPIVGGTEFEVRESFVVELEKLYPAVDIRQTLNEIRGYFIGKPQKRKTPRGIRGCITSWMGREQDKHG